MNAFSQFGIEPLSLIAQIVNFLLLLYILKRFLYKPVLDMLKTREEKIRAGLEEAEQARIALEKATEQEKKILAKAQTEAKAMIADVKDQLSAMEQASHEKMRAEQEKMLMDAKARIAEEERRATEQLEKRSVELSVALIERVLPKVLTKDDQKRITADAQKQLEKALS